MENNKTMTKYVILIIRYYNVIHIITIYNV